MSEGEQKVGAPHHVAALDGVRGLAIAAVFAYHAFVSHKIYGAWAPVRLGYLGVEAFFVLSGFLVTTRLYALRAGAGTLTSRWAAFARRRVARTFPLYYAGLIVFFTLGPSAGFGTAPGAALSYWTYTFNLLSFARGSWVGDGGHFWSLCVEEQFYLLVPLLVLKRAERFVREIAIGASVVAVAARVLTAGEPGPAGMAWMLPMLHFDSFGAGILAASLVSRPIDSARARVVIASVGTVAAVAFIAVVITGKHSAKVETLLPALLAFAIAPLLVALWRGGARGVRRVLGVWPLAALGKVSYGVYLVHVFVIIMLWRFRAPWLPPIAWLRGLCAFALSVGFATLSWLFFERPILRRVR